MSLNDDFIETFVLLVKGDIIKIVLNNTKGTYTVYAPNGKILMRAKKLLGKEMQEIRKQVNDYIKDGKKLKDATPFGGRFL